MESDEIELTLPSTPRPRHVRFAVHGTELHREAWTGNGRPRHGAKDHGTPAAARKALVKETTKRMRRGYAYTRADAAPGEPVLECAVPNHGGSETLDLAPDGRTLAIATVYREAYGAEIHLVDVATGARRLVRTELPAGKQQTFVEAVLFDADGKGLVYALNEQTRRLDLRTGATTVLAGYERWRTSDFSPFHARPVQDASRERLLVFDAGNVVRVLEAHDPLLEVPTGDRGQCRTGALSPSGRLLALSFYDTGLVEVWNVDTGKREASLTFPFPFGRRAEARSRLDRLGFTPDEERLIATSGHAQGPCVASFDGDLLWFDRRPGHPASWATCDGWAFSPDGTVLAVADHERVSFRDGGTFAETGAEPLRPSADRTSRLVFDASGALLACGGDGGRIGVYAVR